MSLNLSPLTTNQMIAKMMLNNLKGSKHIKDPLSLCFSERFLILEKPKTRSKKPFWSNINIGDVLKLTILLKENGNRGKTTQSSCVIVNETKNDTYIDYPVNILRHLKSIKYKQLDK